MDKPITHGVNGTSKRITPSVKSMHIVLLGVAK